MPDGGDVEQHVHQVIGQQVDLVDVEHAAVGAASRPGWKRSSPR